MSHPHELVCECCGGPSHETLCGECADGTGLAIAPQAPTARVVHFEPTATLPLCQVRALWDVADAARAVVDPAPWGLTIARAKLSSALHHLDRSCPEQASGKVFGSSAGAPASAEGSPVEG